MKRIYIFILITKCVSFLFSYQVIENNFSPDNSTKKRYEIVDYSEDFESGAPGWTHYDAAVSPNNWHIYNFGGTQGNVWWMGDPALAQGSNIGGYYNHQYLVLDTPARTLTSANATLTFKMRHNVEDPAGATAPWNGWDACNVRISTNGGATWTPISGNPAYDCTSAYSFGFEHGEGQGIPGWGGVREWTNCTFDLSAYVGQSVKIRFAFASDPAYCTSDAPAMYGMMVDDISFGGYSNNGVDDGQMTYSSLVPVGEDLWHIATDATAPSPTHCAACQNASGSYNTNMLNYLVSPPITLPNSGDMWVDFMVKGSYNDPNAFPEVDYFGWEISVDGGNTWYAMSNPYGTPGGNNYVYTGLQNTWQSMTEGFGLSFFITEYHGETAIFRWYFKSDGDTPDGVGMFIDDFRVYNDVFIAAPENLTAAVSGNSVTLTWNEPGSGGGGGEEGWIYYCGEPAGNSIGTNGAADFSVAAKWDAIGETNSIYPYVGMNITKIKFVPAEPTTLCSYAVRIWTGAAGVLVYDQAVPTITEDVWNEVILTTPYTIPAATTIMVGYRCNAQGGYPAGCDNGPQVEGYGNMIYMNNNWHTLTAESASLTYNWTIQVYVADATGKEYVLGELPMNNSFAEGKFGVHYTEPVRGRDVTGYKVYRDGIFLNGVSANLLTYTDTEVPGGPHSYYVTAMYGTVESGASNTVNTFIIPPQHYELSYDDGTAEQGFSVGVTRQMAVKFNYFGEFDLQHIKVYVHTLGTASIIIRIHDASGVNGMPGDLYCLYHYPATSLVVGWNFITLPTPVHFNNQSFYVGILETTGASQIGLDTSSFGHSYKNISGSWELIGTGEIMLRAIISSDQIDPFGEPITLSTSMTVVCGATINGVQASQGDVLAAYVNVNGSPQLRGKQTVMVQNNIAGCILQVYTEVNGENVTFKIWDQSANQVYSTSNVLPTTVNGTIGSWPDNLYQINGIGYTTQNIPLVSGWNLVSLNVSPYDHSPGSLFAPLIGQVQQVKGTEGIYIPNNPYSTLTALTDGKAYSILMSSPVTWSVTGIQIPASTPIPLVNGWNMAAFLPSNSLSVTTAMSSISSWLIQLKGTDGVYIPSNPYSTLNTMYPGKGYWININGAHNLIYPGKIASAEGIRSVTISPAKEQEAVKMLSNSFTLLAKCPEAEVGDYLLARVNGELRGKELLIAPEGFLAALIQVYSDIMGEEVRFSLWKPSGMEVALQNTISSEPGAIIGNYPNFIELYIEPLTTEEHIAILTCLQGVYPNPFNPSTTISFSVSEDNSPVKITIYNIKGQKVRCLVQENFPCGEYKIIWDGLNDHGTTVSSGVYFAEMRTPGYRKQIKLLLTK